jgi:hypothetical protein
MVSRNQAHPAVRRERAGQAQEALLAAALVTGGVGVVATPAGASRRRKRGKRRSGQHGVDVSERATSTIGPNCIYVCCDGTCDSWKMCMKCVKWPKPTTTGGVLTQA